MMDHVVMFPDVQIFSYFNYDPQACFDDGNCISFIYGCIDTNAYNFDSLANTNDGTCCYILGCTNSSYLQL